MDRNKLPPSGPVSGRVTFVKIEESRLNQRIDNYLMGLLKDIPKSKIYRIIRKGEVRVNKKRVKPEYKLQIDDSVRIPPLIRQNNEVSQAVKVSEGLRQRLKSSLLYESDSLMIFNKPAGLAVHGGSGIQFGLIEALREIYSEYRFLELVHRLDKDTSGCILVAKKRSMLRYLHECFRLEPGKAKGIKKNYHALVVGSWPSYLKEVSAPLQRYELKSGERMVRVHQNGKDSLTRFRVRSRYLQYTLVEAEPVTGRTHQIRVHAAFSGHAVAGDNKYFLNDGHAALIKIPGLKRLMLHAASITLILPELGKIYVEAPYPSDYKKVIKLLADATTLSKGKSK